MSTPTEPPAEVPAVWWSPSREQFVRKDRRDEEYVVLAGAQDLTERPRDAVRLTPEPKLKPAALGMVPQDYYSPDEVIELQEKRDRKIEHQAAELERVRRDLADAREDRDNLLEHRARFRELWEHGQHADAIRHLGYEPGPELARPLSESSVDTTEPVTELATEDVLSKANEIARAAITKAREDLVHAVNASEGTLTVTAADEEKFLAASIVGDLNHAGLLASRRTPREDEPCPACGRLFTSVVHECCTKVEELRSELDQVRAEYGRTIAELDAATLARRTSSPSFAPSARLGIPRRSRDDLGAHRETRLRAPNPRENTRISKSEAR